MFAVDLLAWLLAGLGFALLFLVVLLLVEIYAGATWKAPARARFPLPCKIAVVVPAHNEAAHITKMLRALQAHLRPENRVLVVADNCTDDTFEVARSLGVEALRRNDPSKRGKGYALDFAIKHLAANPPDVVVVMDADCYASPGSIAQLASWAWAYDRPVQAQYEMLLPPGSDSPALAIADFSYRVKAIIRLLGLQRLGWPCGLMGTGMALPWSVISRARLANAEIVEDLLMSLELARDGKAPLYCYDAKITSTFPSSVEGQKSQRERWETGHLNMILRVLPKMVFASLTTGNWRLLALAADTAIPPLALLALLIAFHLGASVLFAVVTGSGLPVALGIVNAFVFFAAIVIAWRAAFPGKGMATLFLRVPSYVFGKLGIYLKVLLRRRIEWVRTQRE